MLSTTGAPESEPLDVSGKAGPPVSIRGLLHAFGDLLALDGIDLEVPGGGVLGIVGPSGCGKSTLLEIASGLLEPSAGRVSVGGAADAPSRTPAGERLARCALMPQRDLLLPWLAAIDNAALGPSLAGASREAARERARADFNRLGLGGFELAKPQELSGGMRQRVAFLRTLISGKQVLLLDEPFASLDAITRAETQAWLAGVLAQDSHTVLLVTHDVEEALYLSDRVAVLTARPARMAATLEVPEPRSPDRAAAVTAADFVEFRERALRLLAGGAR